LFSVWPQRPGNARIFGYSFPDGKNTGQIQAANVNGVRETDPRKGDFPAINYPVARPTVVLRQKGRTLGVLFSGIFRNTFPSSPAKATWVIKRLTWFDVGPWITQGARRKTKSAFENLPKKAVKELAPMDG